MSPRFVRGKLAYVDPVCVECGGMGRMVAGSVLLPYRPAEAGRMFFACSCGAWVTCHPGTAVPAGRPASRDTRRLRFQAHAAFDRLWQGNARTRLASTHARRRAYKWLATTLGLPKGECHIGWMNADECRRVIAACEEHLTRRAA